MNNKITIIGAGPAGLCAALELSKMDKNYDITILEALDQVGGISKTINHNGNRMDIGGHRFFSKEKKITDWWFDILNIQGMPSYDDIMLDDKEKKFAEYGPNPEVDDEVMLVRNRVSRIYYLKKFFDYPVSLTVDTLVNMGFLNTMKVGFSYLKSTIVKRSPEVTLEDFMINRFGYVLYSMFFENYTEKVWGKHPSRISASWGAQRIKGLSIKEIIIDMFKNLSKKNRDLKEVQTSLIQEFYYPKLGPGQLWECVAQKAVDSGVKLELNKKVTLINIEDSEISSIVCEDGSTFDSDIVISSMPIKDLVEAIPEDKVDNSVVKIASDLPYRDFITVGILVDKLKIKNTSKVKTMNNIVPDCWIYIQEDDVKIGRLQIFNNWSPYMVKDIDNTVWLGLEYFCNEGDELWNMNDEEFIDFAVYELDEIGIIDKEDVIDSVRANIPKAYPAYFGSYNKFGEVKNYLDSLDNLYCIGRNGQHRYNNMDHSMITAFYAVEDIISGGEIGKEKVWSVNTEEEYHETNK